MSGIERQQNIKVEKRNTDRKGLAGNIFRFALDRLKNKVIETVYNPDSSFTLAGFHPFAVTVTQVRERHTDRNIGDTLDDMINRGDLKYTRRILDSEEINPRQFYYLGNGFDYYFTHKEQPIFVKVDDDPNSSFEYYLGSEGIVGRRALNWEQVSNVFLKN